MTVDVDGLTQGHPLAGDTNFRTWVKAGLLHYGAQADREKVIAFAEEGLRVTRQQADSDGQRARPFIESERARIRAIIWSRAGQANPQLADFLAFETDADVATAIRALEISLERGRPV